MGDKTHIEWASHTASPWFGCTEVSPGCANCYARQLTLQKKWAGWGDDAPRVRSKGFWKDAYRLDRKAAEAAVNWDREYDEPRGPKPTCPRMFTSLMDWLDKMPAGIVDQSGTKLDPVAIRRDFLWTIFQCQNLDWLTLTKRPEAFLECLCEVYMWEVRHGLQDNEPFRLWLHKWESGIEAPSNVWFGVTVENQAMADRRIPLLLSIPAKVRWLSVEPLLGPLEFSNVSRRSDAVSQLGRRALDGINWVIIGGESGPGARPCNVEWILSIVRQCKAAGVPCFVKQLGSHAVTTDAMSFPDCELIRTKNGNEPWWIRFKHSKGGDPAEWPAELRVREFPR